MEAVASSDSFLVGTWLSLVEHSLGVRGVGSSNLPVPTIQTKLAITRRIPVPGILSNGNVSTIDTQLGAFNVVLRGLL